MELITPPPVRNTILRNGNLEQGGVICELGIYGTCLWDSAGRERGKGGGKGKAEGGVKKEGGGKGKGEGGGKGKVEGGGKGKVEGGGKGKGEGRVKPKEGGKKMILHNEQVGYLLRTKGDQSEEGGVAAGFGCMDSCALV